MPPEPLEISPEDLYRRLQAGDDIQLIDVREEMDYPRSRGSPRLVRHRVFNG